MTQPVTTFKWDDPGAPQIVDGKPSEYMTVIKKALVDGYGSKVATGWIVVVDEIFTTTPLLVLKNDTNLGGSGGFIVFDAVDDTAGTNVKVQSCQAYVDRDTRTNAGAYFVFNRNSSGISMLSEWMILATTTCFYFFANAEYSRSRNVNAFQNFNSIFFFAGDILSFYNNDPGRFITMSGAKNENNHAWSSMLNNKVPGTSASNITDIYALDGSATFESHSINSVLGRKSRSNQVHIEEPSILFMCECFLQAGDSISNDIINNINMPLIRAKIPGLYVSTEAGYHNNAMPYFKYINGASHFLVPSAGSATSMTWINTEQW